MAASAASCPRCGALIAMFCARHSTGRIRSSGSTIQPTRQPVMLQYLLKLLITTGEPGRAAAVVSATAPQLSAW